MQVVPNNIIINMLKILIKEIVNHKNFINDKIFTIGYHKIEGREFYGSVNANSLYTYHSYLSKICSFNSIQINNVETNSKIRSYLRKNFSFRKFLNCSIFFNYKTTYSLPRHKDNYHVFLFVLKGKKKISVQNKKRIIKANEGIIIPKNFSHRVLNQKNTFALSIAYKSLGY